MKLLNTYHQISTALPKSNGVRQYENAALKRRGTQFQLPTDTKSDVPPRPTEKYGVYKRPVRSSALPTERPIEQAGVQGREPYSQKQLQEAIQQYRRISGTGMGYSTGELDQMIRKLVTGQAVELHGEYSPTTIMDYKRRREEITKTREKELWDEFNVEHMLYIDTDKISGQVKSTSSGQFLNYVI